jgi:hypothetical protein
MADKTDSRNTTKCDCGEILVNLSYDGNWGWTEIDALYCRECRVIE